MERVKSFYAVNGDIKNSDILLEDAINKWFESVGSINIKNTLQSSSGRLDHHTTITIFYTI